MRTLGLLLVLALASSVQIARAEIGTLVSADGKTVAVAGSYWTNGKPHDYIVLMDPATGKELKRLGGDVDVQLCSALSPDGQLVALSGVKKQTIGDPAVKKAADAMQKSAGDNAFMQGFMEAAADHISTKDVPFFGWLQTDTGKPMHQVSLGATQVNLVAFTPDGKSVIAGCGDGKIRVFDVATAKLLRTLTGMDEEIMGLSVNADGKRLAARGEYAIKVWDMATGKIVRSIDSSQRTDTLHFSQAMALSPNGLYIAAGDSEKEVSIWSMATGALVRTVKDAKAFAFSPDSTMIATGNEKGNVKVMNIATGQLKKVFKGLSDLPYTDVYSLQFTKDGKLIASGGENVTKVLDLAGGNEVAMFTASHSPIRNVAFDRTGTTLLMGTDRGEVRLVDTASGATKSLIRINKEAPKVAFHPTANLFAVATPGVITLYDAGTGQPTRSINTNATNMSCFQFSHDGKQIAAGFGDSVVRVWDVQSGAELFKLGSAVAQKEVDVMGLLTGAAVKEAADEQKKAQQAAAEPRHSGGIIEIAFSPDDTTIASASVDSTVRIWDAHSGKFLRTLVGHIEQVNGVAFTADGKRLVSGDGKGVVKIWDPQTGAAVQTLKSPDGEIAGLGVVDDGGTVVTSTLFMDKPNFIRLLDATSGNVKRTIPTGIDYPNNIALTPDGKHVAASSIQGLIRVWDLASGEAHTYEPQPRQ